MRLLRNIVLIALPLMLMINLYRWVFTPTDVEFTFKGLAFLHSNIQSFPGLDITFGLFRVIQEEASSFNSIEINNVADVFNAVVKLFQIIGHAFSIPVLIIVDIVRDVWWFIDTMFIK